MRDPALLELLEAVKAQPLAEEVYRVVWAKSEPTRGSSGKWGRWSSEFGEFEVLYTSVEPSGAEAEFEAFWSLFEQRPDRLAETHTLSIRLRKVIHLDFPTLETLGVKEATYQERDYSRTHVIADAINFLEYDGLISPSARHPCNNLTVFFQNISKDDFELKSIAKSKFQWST